MFSKSKEKNYPERKGPITPLISYGKFKFDDLGPFSEDSVDYPDYAKKLSKRIDSNNDSKGVLICGSGIGMSMVANRFKNVRAALCINNKMSMLA